MSVPAGSPATIPSGSAQSTPNPEKPVTRLTLETITHEGTPGEKKQSFDLNPDKPNKPVVVHLVSGRRKKVLPYVDSYAELMKAAAPAMKNAPKRLPRAKGDAPRAAVSHRTRSRGQPSNEICQVAVRDVPSGSIATRGR